MHQYPQKQKSNFQHALIKPCNNKQNKIHLVWPMVKINQNNLIPDA